MIGIITVVTNEKSNLNDFYLSLISQTYNDFTLYFVDNNSADGSMDYFKELNKENSLSVKYVSLDYNSGFSYGSNKGAEYATEDGCDYLFILNSDVVLEKNCIDELIKLIKEDNELACVGLLLMRHQQKLPGIIQEFGGKINFKTGRIEKYFTNEDINKINLPLTIDTDFVGGGACFIKADIFKIIGMFDEKYFSYFDEIDLSYRLKKLNNYTMRCTSKAVAYHNHNWTKKNKYSYYFEYYLSERNKYVYFYKYRKYFSIIRSLFTDIIKFPWRLIWFVRVCDFSLGFYYLYGLFAGFFGHKGKPKLKFLN